METELLSPKDLAIHTGWPVRRIRNLITANQIRHIRIGGNIYSPKNAIDEYIQANMIEPSCGQAQDQPEPATVVRRAPMPIHKAQAATDTFNNAVNYAHKLTKKNRR